MRNGAISILLLGLLAGCRLGAGTYGGLTFYEMPENECRTLKGIHAFRQENPQNDVDTVLKKRKGHVPHRIEYREYWVYFRLRERGQIVGTWIRETREGFTKLAWWRLIKTAPGPGIPGIRYEGI